MPAPLDLVGLRVGKLLVLARAADILSDSGKSRYAAWLCRCDCGREEVFRQKRLPYCPSNAAHRAAATSCSVCRHTRLCMVCCREFISEQVKATCSEACHLLHRRAMYMEAYWRKTERDPEVNKKRSARIRERMAADPEYAAKIKANSRAQTRKRAEILAHGGTEAERLRAQTREYYAAHADEIQARQRELRQARLKAMSPQELERYQKRVRAYMTRKSREYRATPEGQAAARAARQKHLAKQKMGQMLHLSEELENKRQRGQTAQGDGG